MWFKRVTALSFVIVVGLVGPVSVADSPPVWVFSGSGWGHGLGMSQWGAKGYADSGWTYPQILTHYYQQTTVASRPAKVPSTVRVGVLTSAPQVHLAANGQFEFVNNNVVVASGGAGESWRVDNSGGKFLLRRNGATVAENIGSASSPLMVRFENFGSRLQITEAGHWYAYGTFEIRIEGSGVRGVLDIPAANGRNAMDRYLYGLGEVPSSWHVEALKAQAVAARSYAAEKINNLGQNRSGCSCGLYASVSDQAYIGYDKESGDSAGRWRSAVDATSNELVLYNDNPIPAFYSSSSGGHTENNENVWGGNPLPYLRGVKDDGDLKASPYIGWSKTFTQAQLEAALNSSSTTAVGSLQSITPLDPLGVSLRIGRGSTSSNGGIKLVGSSGTKVVSGDAIRGALGLRSTLFTVGTLAYEGRFPGGVHVAAGDLLNNGSMEITVSPGFGGGPHIRVMRENGEIAKEWFAYDPNFYGGVMVATGDVLGTSNLEVVTVPFLSGGPHVRVWDSNGQMLSEFFAFPADWTTGLSVAVGDVEGDGTNEIIVGGGPGREPRVRVFTPQGRMKYEWDAYDPSFRGGVRVAAGRINAGLTRDLIMTGPGPGGGPHVRIWDGANLVGQFFAYGTDQFSGVFVAVADIDKNGEDELVTAPDANGSKSVRVWRGNSNLFDAFDGSSSALNGGIRVSGYDGHVVTGYGPGWLPIFRVWHR